MNILGYCPYTNLKHASYPHMLLTTSLSDTIVPYWQVPQPTNQHAFAYSFAQHDCSMSTITYRDPKHQFFLCACILFVVLLLFILLIGLHRRSSTLRDCERGTRPRTGWCLRGLSGTPRTITSRGRTQHTMPPSSISHSACLSNRLCVSSSYWFLRLNRKHSTFSRNGVQHRQACGAGLVRT
jgi:hypothetical protein